MKGLGKEEMDSKNSSIRRESWLIKWRKWRKNSGNALEETWGLGSLWRNFSKKATFNLVIRNEQRGKFLLFSSKKNHKKKNSNATMMKNQKKKKSWRY